MPSLPRIRRPRPRSVGDLGVRPRPEPSELGANGLTWIHLDAPDHEAAALLSDRFGWHPLDVEDVLSKRQRPKVDDYLDEGYLFAVLHFPVYDPAVQRLNAAELDVFVGPDYLVTLPAVELLPVTRLYQRCVDAAERIWDILDNYKEVVEALEDTNESVISHRQNDVLRILTVFSVILLPLTLITGFFGMNVRFPGYETAWAFWLVFVGMIVTLIGLLAFFRLKRWL